MILRDDKKNLIVKKKQNQPLNFIMAQVIWTLVLSAIVLSQRSTYACTFKLNSTENLRNVLYDPVVQRFYVIGEDKVYVFDNDNVRNSSFCENDQMALNSTVPETYNAQILHNYSLILLQRNGTEINRSTIMLNTGSDYSQKYDSDRYGSDDLAFTAIPSPNSIRVFHYFPHINETRIKSFCLDNTSPCNTSNEIYSGDNITYFKAGLSLRNDSTKAFFIAKTETVAKFVLIDVTGDGATEYNLTCKNGDLDITNGRLLLATVIESTNTKRGFLTLFRTQNDSLLCLYTDEQLLASILKNEKEIEAEKSIKIQKNFNITSLSGIHLSSIDDLIVYIGTASGKVYWSHVLKNETNATLRTHSLHSSMNTSIKKLLVTNHSVAALTDREVLVSVEDNCKGGNWSECSKQQGYLCGWSVTNNICMKLPENVPYPKYWIPSQRMRVLKIKPGTRMGSKPEFKVKIRSPYFSHANDKLTCYYPDSNTSDTNCGYPNTTNEEGLEERRVQFRLGNSTGPQVGETLVYYYNCSAFNSVENCSKDEDKKFCTWLYCSEKCIDTGPVQDEQRLGNGNSTQPKICKVTPNTTTLDGNETIIIYGENLGRSSNESLSILLAGVECKLKQSKMLNKLEFRLECQAGVAEKAVSGRVNITIGGRSFESTSNFTYKKMADWGLEFPKGPVAGGTKLVLKGEDFDVAEMGRVAVVINGTYNCTVTSVTSDQINCTTGEGKEGQNLSMSIIYRDAVTVDLSNSTFTYLPNPRLDYIEPNVTFNSGGTGITLHGIGFLAIQRPEIALENSTDFHGCSSNKTNTMVVCPSPEMPQVGGSFVSGRRKKRQADASTLNRIQVRMDGVHLSTNLTYVDDPIFHNFTEEGQIRGLGADEHLVITGERLNAAADAGDYKITIGKEECKVFATITETTLSCDPPPKEPKPIHASSEAPEVEIKLGNIVRRVGYIRYMSPAKTPTDIIIGVLVCVAIVILVGSVVLARYFINKNKKKMNEKMDKLELEIREQCREVFAELQTDMTDVTEELVEVGIPFQPFYMYVLQFIFPTFDVNHLQNHVALTELQEHEGTKEDLQASMTQLDQLVNNKFFLVSAIKTLDNQNMRKLTVKERSDIAAYISLLLMNKMEYFTEVVETLLMKHGCIYKNTKDFFKRYETITEKLVLNWFAMCMYNPLKKHSGSALYILYKAIESVSQKFAIDAITGKSRATLSPHNLLVLDFEPEVITITVQINNGRFETSCRVLDCDTITQMKTKCLNSAYKRETASERPGVDDVDLEWRITPNTGKLLYDEDSSSTVLFNGYRKLNTVRHYGITNGSTVCLLSKERECVECDYVNHGSIVSLDETKILMQSEDTESKMSDSPPQLEQLPTVHLVQENDPSKTVRGLPEINYQRHLQTKMSLKKFIDDMVDNIVTMDEVPDPVRHLFSQLEKVGLKEGVDNSTIESWKIQSYGIRFWTRLLSRPDILFDLNKTSNKYVQPNMNIIALAYIDSYSPPQDLGKNSLTEKLLFYKDCMTYREKINQFFSSRIPSAPVAMEIFSQDLDSLPCTLASKVINRQSVLYQFYMTIDSFASQIRSGLLETPETNRLQLSSKLDDVFKKLRNS